jgi:glucose-1-phosphatase
VVSALRPTLERGDRQDTRIRAICLDFGNVLVPFDYKRLWRGLVPCSALSETEMARRFQESRLSTLYESGKLSSESFYREMSSLLEITLSYQTFCAEWSSIFDLDSNVDLPFLSSLARDYVLVLVSNTNELHFDFMQQQYSVVRAFHHFALSFRVGVTKPAREIYTAALNMALVDASEAFYADDIKSYVDTALELGFRAAQVRNKEELVGAMSRNGITLP